MQVKAAWYDTDGRRGEIQSRFAAVEEAEAYARGFMSVRPWITKVGIYHDTGDWLKRLTDVTPDGKSSSAGMGY